MYRWTLKTIPWNIKWIFNDIMYGIYNVFRWIPVIWKDRDFDWGYLASIMEYKFRRMSGIFKNGYHTSAKRDAKRTLICAELLKRMEEDNKPEMNQFYQEYLGKLIGKYFMSWWD